MAGAKKKTTRKSAAKKTAAKKATVKKTAATPKPAQAATPNGFFNYQPDNKAMETMMTQNKVQMDQFAQDAATAGREATEAFVQFGTIFAKGFEEILRASMEIAQDTTEKQTQYMKEIMSSKTLNEFTEVQSKIAQASFDDFMTSSTKISEMSVKLLTEASEPLNEQISKAMSKASAMAA